MLAYSTYLLFFTGFIQRLILVPLTFGFPASSNRVLASWGRLQARSTLFLLRAIAGVRVQVDGAIGPENRLVIMNHQSLIDIVIGLRACPGNLTMIPTRSRYARGIPGVSKYLRLARFPLITQTRKSIRDDLAVLAEAADRCRLEGTSLLIFPEGHRTKDGSILPFMMRGLRTILSRAPLPVYCLVADGMWQARTFGDTARRVADSRIQVRIIGPFDPPREESEIVPFIHSLRDKMINTLNDMRAGVATQRPSQV